MEEQEVEEEVKGEVVEYSGGPAPEPEIEAQSEAVEMARGPGAIPNPTMGRIVWVSRFEDERWEPAIVTEAVEGSVSFRATVFQRTGGVVNTAFPLDGVGKSWCWPPRGDGVSMTGSG